MTTDQPMGQAGARKLRLFIAVPLPADIRAQVAALSGNLQKGVQFTPNRPSWSDPATTHLTLLFLGQTDEDKVPAITRALDRVGPQFAPLRIEVKRLGVFPNWRSPRVLWAGIRERSHQITDLQKAVERAMVNLGYVPEEKEFHPHLTLARFKQLKGVSMIEKIVNDHQRYMFGPFEAPEVVLYKSELNPGGARHTALHRVTLSAPPRPRAGGDENHDDEE